MHSSLSAGPILLLFSLFVSACASFEPGMRYRDLMRPRQPPASANGYANNRGFGHIS